MSKSIPNITNCDLKKKLIIFGAHTFDNTFHQMTILFPPYQMSASALPGEPKQAK